MTPNAPDIDVSESRDANWEMFVAMTGTNRVQLQKKEIDMATWTPGAQGGTTAGCLVSLMMAPFIILLRLVRGR
jgi:hypothetical protein